MIAKRKGADLLRHSTSQHSTMWWSDGVADAIKTCQLRKSVLVILVEPPEDVLQKRAAGFETNQQMLSRVSTTSMHRITFSHAAVTSTIRDSQAVCLKFPSEESNEDFKAFTAYFKLHGIPPNLYFISSLTGQTLVHKCGFVSPKIFLDSLAATTENVSGRVLSVPELGPRMSIAGVSVASPAEPAWTDEQREEQDQNDAVGDVQHQAQMAPEDERMTTTPDSRSRDIVSQGKPAISSTPAISGSKSMKLPGGSKDGYVQESRLLARLPEGEQARKSFPGTTPFSVVRSWLSEEVKSPANALVISTVFPRRVFDLGENPKMLSELGLVPSETLIVAVSGNAAGATPREQTANAHPASGLKAYVVGALGMVGGFFRSFVADNPNAAAAAQEQHQSQFLSAPPHGTAGTRVPPAIRIDRPRANRSRPDDDENLLSNGNSTQYGWNPRDEEEDLG